MPSPIAKSAVRVSLGTMEFGRGASESQSLTMVQSFFAAGYTELDTALMYAGGESERIIGRFPSDIKSHSTLHTKANPWNTTDPQLRGLTATSVTKQAHTSLASLQLHADPAAPPIDIFYLHAPCTLGTPLDETLAAVDALHREGVFRRLGLSNYPAWRVMECYQLCVQRGWVRPAVYQVGVQGQNTPDSCQSTAPTDFACTLSRVVVLGHVQQPHQGGGAGAVPVSAAAEDGVLCLQPAGWRYSVRQVQIRATAD